MQITIRGYESRDLPLMVAIWNEVVEDGIAFPQEELLTEESGREFFAGQSWCGVAEDEAGKVLGLYILHPNNVGRCGHICNASYAVSKKARGLHIGEKLVLDCLKKGKKHGFGVLQFNAVSHQPARPAPLRAAGLYPAGYHSQGLPDEGRAL